MTPRILRYCMLFAALMLPLAGAQAHPLAPALLELRAVGDGHFDVRWQLSLLQPSRAHPEPVLPASCQPVRAQRSQLLEAQQAVELRWQIRCDAPLIGQRLAVRGLADSGVNALVVLHDREGRTTQALLDATSPSMQVPAAPSVWAVMGQYGGLGFTHLLFGPDHLAFVVGLFFLVNGFAFGLRPLLIMTAAFTVGHSVTLALSVLGIVRLSPALAEAGIALSIVWVGWRVLRQRGQASAALVHGRRAALATFAFGLLHGLGFAGALRALGLPETAMIPALAAFNIGIELGQLAAIGLLALLLHALPRALFQDPRRPVTVTAAYAVGSLGAFWSIDRLLQLAPAVPLIG